MLINLRRVHMEFTFDAHCIPELPMRIGSEFNEHRKRSQVANCAAQKATLRSSCSFQRCLKCPLRRFTSLTSTSTHDDVYPRTKASNPLSIYLQR